MAGLSITSQATLSTGLRWAGGGWRMARRRSLAFRRLWFHLESFAKLKKGQIDDGAASEPQLAATMNWTKQPSPFADQFSQIWFVRVTRTGTLYAGTKPATKIRSWDGAAKVGKKSEGLRDHPGADSWSPGGAGLVLHTILFDPANAKKLWVGILQLASLLTRMAARPGIVVTGCQIRGPALYCLIPRGPATAESDIASTT